MRPLEILLTVANLLALVGLGFPRLRWGLWAPGLAVLCVAIQALAEGPRWQMAPAYGLAGLVLLYGAFETRRPASRAVRAVVAGAILMGWFVSVALPLALPVFRLPAPQGPYAVGTTTYHWIDEGRRELFVSDPAARRELMVQVYYPAIPGPGPREPYVAQPRVLATTARLLHLPAFIFGHLKYARTNAVAAAPVSPAVVRYPVLIFLSGRGGYRQSNSQQIEALVSHGYIVAAVDQPYAASGVAFPDGRIVAMDPRLFDPAHPGHPAIYDRFGTSGGGAVGYLAQDVSFALGRLALLDRNDPQGRLTGRIDVDHAGIFAVSLGGIIAGEACLREPRLRACLAMDAPMPPDVAAAGLRQPTLWLSRDAASMRREGWAEADVEETQRTMRAAFEHGTGPGYLVLIPGMFHANFSDAPLLTPFAGQLGLAGPIDPRRGQRIVNAYSLAFFDAWLKDGPRGLFEGGKRPYPEVRLAMRRGAGSQVSTRPRQ